MPSASAASDSANPRSEIAQFVPKDQRPLSQLPLSQIPGLDQTINFPEPSPCDPAEDVLNGFLPETVTLTKNDTYWAKLTVGPGASILECDLSDGRFEVRFNNVTLDQYGKASVGGISVGGWNRIAPPLSGKIRVGFHLGFSPPNTVVFSNLAVLDVDIENSPNWLDDNVIKQGLNSIFPTTLAFQI